MISLMIEIFVIFMLVIGVCVMVYCFTSLLETNKEIKEIKKVDKRIEEKLNSGLMEGLKEGWCQACKIKYEDNCYKHCDIKYMPDDCEMKCQKLINDLLEASKEAK